MQDPMNVHILGHKVFRLGPTSIFLPFVMRLDAWPAMEGVSFDDDEKRPRLLVTFLTNGSIQITEREAQAAGFADIAELEAGLIQSLDALD